MEKVLIKRHDAIKKVWVKLMGNTKHHIPFMHCSSQLKICFGQTISRHCYCPLIFKHTEVRFTYFSALLCMLYLKHIKTQDITSNKYLPLASAYVMYYRRKYLSLHGICNN